MQLYHRTHPSSLEKRLDALMREVNRMAVTQEQLDTDLAALVTATADLQTAVTAWVAANQPPDFTAEDTQVQTAAASVAAALAAVTPPAPPDDTTPAG
jgi:hypothetical protein